MDKTTLLNANLPDNNNGLITPAVMRNTLAYFSLMTDLDPYHANIVALQGAIQSLVNVVPVIKITGAISTTLVFSGNDQYGNNVWTDGSWTLKYNNTTPLPQAVGWYIGNDDNSEWWQSSSDPFFPFGILLPHGTATQNIIVSIGNGASGSFTSADGMTVTVIDGVITSIAAAGPV